MSCFILFAKDSRKITVRQLEFSQKRTIGSTKNKTTTIFCSFSFFFSAGITITKNYLRKKYIDSGRDRAFLNLVSLVRSCAGSLAAIFSIFASHFFSSNCHASDESLSKRIFVEAGKAQGFHMEVKVAVLNAISQSCN